MQNVSDVPVKQLVPPEATLAQVHQEGPTTKNGFLRVAEATPPRSQRSANALQGPARRTGTPPPPASHVATGCPWTSRLQLLCIKQIETSTSMLQKKAGSETMRADRLQIALHAARRLSNVDRPPSRILQAGRASHEKIRGRRCDYSDTPWAMNRSCNSAVTSRTLTLPSRKKASSAITAAKSALSSTLFYNSRKQSLVRHHMAVLFVPDLWSDISTHVLLVCGSLPAEQIHRNSVLLELSGTSVLLNAHFRLNPGRTALDAQRASFSRSVN